ncbi:unnamed protein product [Lampetra planeri]
MALRSELLKSVWHAFTALDTEKSGKVSKSQLKVLSHNLCTVLHVPHDPVALEEHFRDDDQGPVSSHGYMPYLNTYILDKVKPDTFDKSQFDEVCWMISAKKNYPVEERRNSRLDDKQAFHLWCLFNFLSEESYPLVIVAEEVDYLMKKLAEAIGLDWRSQDFEELVGKNETLEESGISAWQFIRLFQSPLPAGLDFPSLALAIDDVYNELVLNITKKGYLFKKGHKRKNWNERWFILRNNILSYYTAEDMKDKKGEVVLEKGCSVEVLPERDGRRCFFVIKCPDKSFDVGVEDARRRQEWLAVIQLTMRMQQEGKRSVAHEQRQRRHEERAYKQAEREELYRMQQQQENRQRELMRLEQERLEAEERATQAESKRMRSQEEMQEHFKRELEREKLARVDMEEQIAQKTAESHYYQRRIRELEEMYDQLCAALEVEKRAKLEQEQARLHQARLLEEEGLKRRELEQLRQEQTQLIVEAREERRVLEQERNDTELALRSVVVHLEQLEQDRREAVEKYELASTRLENARGNAKSWRERVMEQERQIGLLRPIQPGHKDVAMSSHRGLGAFPPQKAPRETPRKKAEDQQVADGMSALHVGSGEAP